MLPPRAQVDQPGRVVLQFAGEPEGRRRGAGLRRAPRVVVDDAERRAGIGYGAPDAAQGVGGVPGARAAGDGCEAIEAIQVFGCRVALGLEDLAEF